MYHVVPIQAIQASFEEHTTTHMNLVTSFPRFFSGHLYERLLKIMMLSTIRHTNAPVKFWILKHYLSPSLRDFLPAFAKEYGFQYEYVQYKWPRWLNQQKEKQRIIWGYKVGNLAISLIT